MITPSNWLGELQDVRAVAKGHFTITVENHRPNAKQVTVSGP